MTSRLPNTFAYCKTLTESIKRRLLASCEMGSSGLGSSCIAHAFQLLADHRYQAFALPEARFQLRHPRSHRHLVSRRVRSEVSGTSWPVLRGQGGLATSAAFES